MAKQTKGWLDNYGEEANANEGSSSAPKGWMGEGYGNVGRKYSPAWGGQFQLGGNVIPGAVGFTYARTNSPAPSEGPYAKKTLPSAENGMSYYQHGLDWKPKTISKKGGVIKDDRGYWNPDNWGEVVEIDSPYITMQGVNKPLLGISDTGDVQYMEPGQDYEYDGNKVTEFPIMRGGGLMKAQNGFGCKGKSKCITGSDEKKKDGVSDSDGGGIGNYVPMSNAPATWEELQTYNETNPKSKEFKAQLKSLQGQFPGLTAQQLLAAGADSARVNLRKQNLQRYDQPSEQTFDRAYHMFYRPLMNQQNRVTVPQILQQQPGGFSNFEQNVRSNYGRSKNENGGITKQTKKVNQNESKGWLSQYK